MILSDRLCVRCGAAYTPTGARDKYCDLCRAIAYEEKRQEREERRQERQRQERRRVMEARARDHGQY